MYSVFIIVLVVLFAWIALYVWAKWDKINKIELKLKSLTKRIFKENLFKKAEILYPERKPLIRKAAEEYNHNNSLINKHLKQYSAQNINELNLKKDSPILKLLLKIHSRNTKIMDNIKQMIELYETQELVVALGSSTDGLDNLADTVSSLFDNLEAATEVYEINDILKDERTPVDEYYRSFQSKY